MKTLFVLNEAPYGNERSYNALRFVGSLAKRENEEVKIFLFGDGVACAKSNQKVPQGFYNIEVMLKASTHHGVEIGICGSCLDARGIGAGELAEGTKRSSLEELTDWTLWADKVAVF
jgi:uncharacterized protein involved in oxidation of intracellular sulfur